MNFEAKLPARTMSFSWCAILIRGLQFTEPCMGAPSTRVCSVRSQAVSKKTLSVSWTVSYLLLSNEPLLQRVPHPTQLRRWWKSATARENVRLPQIALRLESLASPKRECILKWFTLVVGLLNILSLHGSSFNKLLFFLKCRKKSWKTVLTRHLSPTSLIKMISTTTMMNCTMTINFTENQKRFRPNRNFKAIWRKKEAPTSYRPLLQCNRRRFDRHWEIETIHHLKVSELAHKSIKGRSRKLIKAFLLW